MLPLPSNAQPGRCLMFFIVLYVIMMVAGMMMIGSMNLVDPTLFWARISVGAACFLAAYGYTHAAVRKGKPAWLVKGPPDGPEA